MTSGLKQLLRGAAAIAAALMLVPQADAAGGTMRYAAVSEPAPLDVMLTTAGVSLVVGGMEAIYPFAFVFLNDLGRYGLPAPVTDFGTVIYPEGFRVVLDEVAAYGLPIVITENGESRYPRGLVEVHGGRAYVLLRYTAFNDSTPNRIAVVNLATRSVDTLLALRMKEAPSGGRVVNGVWYLWGRGIETDAVERFDERSALGGSLERFALQTLIDRLFDPPTE